MVKVKSRKNKIMINNPNSNIFHANIKPEENLEQVNNI